MAFWDKIFSKEKKPEQTAPAASSSDRVREGMVKESQESVPSAGKKTQGVLTGVLTASHVTEKTTDMSERGAYVFSVARTANKHRVASAVEARYEVKVDRVRMIIQPPKERKRGRQIGWKPGFKKAIVQLEKGQKIETL